MAAARRAGQGGWTFVEMAMVVVVLLVVMAGVFLLLNAQSDFWELSTTQTDLRSDVSRAMAEMSRELRHARRVTPGVAPNITIAPGNAAITFFVPTDTDVPPANGVLDDIGNVQWNAANPIQYTYDAGSQRLLRIEGAATRVLATDVTAVTFRDQAADATLLSNEVKIALTVQRTTPHRRDVVTSATSVVRLRN